MKTALQELIDDLQDMCPDYYNNNYNWIHNLLDKEKQQMKDSVLAQCTTHDGLRKIFDKQFEEYYTETFKTK